MAETISTPVELGFSDFVGKLIADTFDAIMSSQAGQEQQWIELLELIEKPFDEFAETVISDEDIDEVLIDNFPNNDGGHKIVVGQPYKPRTTAGNRKRPETIPIEEKLGYKPKGPKLTQTDVKAIKDLVRTPLAEKQFELLTALVKKGNTRVIVDGGKINAKMTFNILQVEEKDNGTVDPTKKKKIRTDLLFDNKRNTLITRKVPSVLKNVHLFVKPTSDKDPQSTTVNANIFSEVEIHFKTIQ